MTGSLPQAGLTVWTIGHSTRSLEEFIALLRQNHIEVVADVRRHAGSRKFPHFNPEALARGLHEAHIGYTAFPDLGGRRTAKPDSANTAWRNASFRGYADYMETPPFKAALGRFIAVATQQRSALMCAEAVWWRCHRSLIADVLKVDGAKVLHIMEAGKSVEHPYTTAARVDNGHLSYGQTQGHLPL
ncbi:MAG TPA: DUF488 domain-containing protein [Burkholderiales bacterium]|nr:DUF488 domain-containing protein [Burkholderiales bacterium]